MVGVVISAGGNVTGATVNALVGGATQVVSTNATIYNQMQARHGGHENDHAGLESGRHLQRDLAELLSHGLLQHLGYRGLRLHARRG